MRPQESWWKGGDFRKDHSEEVPEAEVHPSFSKEPFATEHYDPSLPIRKGCFLQAFRRGSFEADHNQDDILLDGFGHVTGRRVVVIINLLLHEIDLLLDICCGERG